MSYTLSTWDYHYPSGGMVLKTFENYPNLEVETVASIPKFWDKDYVYVQSYTIHHCGLEALSILTKQQAVSHKIEKFTGLYKIKRDSIWKQD